ncbi:MAG: hypothetical protein WCZ98_04355 [Sideroxydans sp.]
MEQMLMADVIDESKFSEVIMDRLTTLADHIGFMPDCSVIDPKEDVRNDVAFLHYTLEETHWYITHRDSGKRQWTAHGLIYKGEGLSNRDDICVVEILRAGASIDLDWQPKPLRHIMMK